MLADASKRKFDVLLFWSIDRFSREGILPVLTHMKRPSDYGVKYRSFEDPYIDTTHEFGDLLAAFAAKLAELERKRIRARAKRHRVRPSARCRQSGQGLGAEGSRAQHRPNCGHHEAVPRNGSARVASTACVIAACAAGLDSQRRSVSLETFAEFTNIFQPRVGLKERNLRLPRQRPVHAARRAAGPDATEPPQWFGFTSARVGREESLSGKTGHPQLSSYLTRSFFSSSGFAEIASQCVPFAKVPGSCSNLLGNAGRNSIVVPNLYNVDFSVPKDFAVAKVSEAFKVQFRTEFFNVLNHANFTPPLPFFGSSNAQIFNPDGTPSGGGRPAVTAGDEAQDHSVCAEGLFF
jgi:hypothetical protein